jgi:DHA1 family quinolone resistance protein-like MFS transporter
MTRNRTLLPISLSIFAVFIGVGMVIPVRILYAQSRGASLAIIGAMASSFLLSNFLFQYPVGWLADLWGRKLVMSIGLAAQSVLSLIYLAVTDPVLFVVLRFAEGIMAAGVLPAARALIADSVEPDQRGEAYGIFGAFMNAGFLLGPALGGVFAAVGYSSAFVGSCAFRVVALIIVLTLVRVGNPSRAETRARARAVPRCALFTIPLIGTYILTFGDNLYFGFDLTLMPLWMRHNLGAPVAAIGLAYTAWALPNVIGSPLGGRLADRARRSTMIVGFGMAQVPLYVSYGLVNLAWPVVLIFGIHGAVYALMQPSVDATLAAASPSDARARAQSMYSAFGLVGAFVAANALSPLYGINFRLPLFAMGAGFGLCVLIGGLLIRLSERDGERAPRAEKAAVAE